MTLSKEAEKELLELSKSESLKKDMQTVISLRHNPFVKDGRADADAYIEFVTLYNEFINHRPKPFSPIVDKIMKL